MSREIADIVLDAYEPGESGESGEKKRLIDANRLEFYGKYYNKSQMNAILDFIDMQPTAYDVDKTVEKLKKVSYERFGNTGMGGEVVVNLDDAIKIIRTGDVNHE